MDQQEPLHSQASLLAVAKVRNVTFNSWRRRNGLFPRTLTSGRKWNYYTEAEICVARTVVVLTNQGLGAEEAASIGMALLPIFERGMPLTEEANLCVISNPSIEERFSMEVLSSTDQLGDPFRFFGARSAAIVINLSGILFDVVTGLEALKGTPGASAVLDMLNPEPHWVDQPTPIGG